MKRQRSFHFFHLFKWLTIYFFCLILSVSLCSCSACASFDRACSNSCTHYSTRNSYFLIILRWERCFCLFGSYLKIVSSFSRLSVDISLIALTYRNLMSLSFNWQSVSPKAFTDIYIHFAKDVFVLYEVWEMGIEHFPSLVFGAHHFSKVDKKIGFHLVFIQEAKLFVDERLYLDAMDGFGLVQHIIVELPFHFILGVSIDVNTKIFPTAYLHGFRVTNCRIIIQVK